MKYPWPPPKKLHLTAEERTTYWKSHEEERNAEWAKFEAEQIASGEPLFIPSLCGVVDEDYSNKGYNYDKEWPLWKYRRVRVIREYGGNHKKGATGVVVDWDDGQPVVAFCREAGKTMGMMTEEEFTEFFHRTLSTQRSAPIDCLEKYEKVREEP